MALVFTSGRGGVRGALWSACRRSKASHLARRRQNVTGLCKANSRRSAANLICDNNLYVNISVTGLEHRHHNTRYSNFCWHAKLSTLLFYSSSSTPSHQIHSFQSIMQQAIHTSMALQYSHGNTNFIFHPFLIVREYYIFAANKRNSRMEFKEIFVFPHMNASLYCTNYSCN